MDSLGDYQSPGTVTINLQFATLNQNQTTTQVLGNSANQVQEIMLSYVDVFNGEYTVSIMCPCPEWISKCGRLDISS